MKHNPLIGKHIHNNRESKEGQILRFIREIRKLSLLDVALKLNLKAIDIDHYENGRRFYTPEEIDLFLNLYQFKKEHFMTLLNLKVINKPIVNHFILGIKGASRP